MANVKILDACCGSKMFWFDREHKETVYMDNRTENTTLCDGRKLIVKPDIVADFREMPFKDETFYLVVFDPPHLVSAGNTFFKTEIRNVRAGMERGYKTGPCRMLAGTQTKWNVNF